MSSTCSAVWSVVARMRLTSSPMPRERALLSSMPAARAALWVASWSLDSRSPRMFSASAALALIRSASFWASRSRMSSSRVRMRSRLGTMYLAAMKSTPTTRSAPITIHPGELPTLWPTPSQKPSPGFMRPSVHEKGPGGPVDVF